jgi:hypothetical protein
MLRRCCLRYLFDDGGRLLRGHASSCALGTRGADVPTPGDSYFFQTLFFQLFGGPRLRRAMDALIGDLP